MLYRLLYHLLYAFIISGAAMASDNSTPNKMAVNILDMLRLDTSGTAALSKAGAVSHARDGVAKAAAVLGVPFTKQVISTAGKPGMLVDTGLIVVTSVTYDSIVNEIMVPVRALTRTPRDSIVYLSQPDPTQPPVVLEGTNATMYSHQWGSDTIVVGSISSNVDSFTVTGFRQALVPATDTSVMEIPTEWRQAAKFYGAYLAAMVVAPGRQGDFYAAYEREVADIWRQRGIEISATEASK